MAKRVMLLVVLAVALLGVVGSTAAACGSSWPCAFGGKARDL